MVHESCRRGARGATPATGNAAGRRTDSCLRPLAGDARAVLHLSFPVLLRCCSLRAACDRNGSGHRISRVVTPAAQSASVSGGALPGAHNRTAAPSATVRHVRQSEQLACLTRRCGADQGVLSTVICSFGVVSVGPFASRANAVATVPPATAPVVVRMAQFEPLAVGAVPAPITHSW
jgi:hypothetical protein